MTEQTKGRQKSPELIAMQQQLLQIELMRAQIKMATAQLDVAQNPPPSLTDKVVGAGLSFIGWYIFGFIALLFVLAAVGKG